MRKFCRFCANVEFLKVFGLISKIKLNSTSIYFFVRNFISFQGLLLEKYCLLKLLDTKSNIQAHHRTILTLYGGSVAYMQHIIFDLVIFSGQSGLLCVFIAIFELLLVRPHFLNYFFFIFARVMVRDISLTQGSEKHRGTYLFCYDIVLSHELLWYSFF